MQKKLTLKFCRFGRKNLPVFRLGILPKFRHPAKQFAIEFVGWYNPMSKKFSVNEERLKYYLGLNIELTSSVQSFLAKNNYVPKIERKEGSKQPQKSKKSKK
jgi:ribosomal protein S16